jgi:hypothetical protein
MEKSKEKDIFFELYKQGYSCQQIADKYYYARETIRWNVKRHPDYNKTSKRSILFSKSLAGSFPDKMYLYDYEKNELKPEDLLPYSKTKIWLKCPKDNHSWSAPAHLICRHWKIGEDGCRLCRENKNLLVSFYPEQIRKYWNKEKNQIFSLDLNKITRRSNRKGWFKCSTHNHEWDALIKDISRSWDKGNTGCSVCRKNSSITEI